ncbi:hypothetical protein [Quatrionicoccus australiensis]|uniref:hypothetical protein n=1 Tax=Quatrionicoccus australiensis TaxID=138118 RepID=UPI001CF8A87A|nr:hypothetical protein [Quatrionicoccus australiensis]UCV13801.1 hypothetical protein KI612_12630 [Quatrionicoccus australiensis]
MRVEMELWHLITLLLAFFSCVGVFGRLLLGQFEKRQQERFAAQEVARKEAQAHWDERFASLDNSAKEWARVERDFLEFKAVLPMTYVIRDDYVRNQTVIEAKLDALALRLENAQLKGKL